LEGKRAEKVMGRKAKSWQTKHCCRPKAEKQSEREKSRKEGEASEREWKAGKEVLGVVEEKKRESWEEGKGQ